MKYRRVLRWAVPLGAVVLVGAVGLTAWLVMRSSAHAERAVDAPQGPAAAEARPVRTIVVASGCVQTGKVYPGVVRASQSAKLAFRVGGPIVEVNVKPGDAVKKGTVLMQIDRRDYENAVAATQAQVDAARARYAAMTAGARAEDIRSLEANLAAAEARRDFARQQFERFESLLVEKAVSMSQFESIQSELSAAEAAVRAAQEELKKGNAGARAEDLLAAEAEIRALETKLKVAKESRDDCTLIAPFSGVVTRQFVEQFETVDANHPAVAMHNIATLEIDVHLPEQELALGDPSQPMKADVRFRAAGEASYPAVLHELSTEADPATRTYLVTFSMIAPEEVRILPGMTAEVGVSRERGDTAGASALIIPSAAIVTDSSGRTYVWVVQPDSSTVEKRPIRTGRLVSEDCYEVAGGLRGGERIVTAGASYLAPGMPVAPMP